MCGDARQVLPILGLEEYKVKDCTFKDSKVYAETKIFSLTINMRIEMLKRELQRVQGESKDDGEIAALQKEIDEQTEYAKTVLDYGDGNVPQDEDSMVQLPGVLFDGRDAIHNKHDLVDKVFPRLHQRYKDEEWVAGRAILAMTNEATFELNDYALDRLPGIAKTYESYDTIMEQRTATAHVKGAPSVGLLRQSTPNGFPHGDLVLKIGALAMLLRNLSLEDGLVNGTKLIVVKMLPNIIIGRIVSGNEDAIGEEVCIPRIVFRKENAAGGNSPYTHERRQFPLRLSYSITTNKSQGQSLDAVGLDLTVPAFAHGQLYVALTRVRTPRALHLMLPQCDLAKRRTRNVVMKHVLR